VLNPFRRGADPQLLVVGMTGVKMGERFAQIGCAHGGRLGAVASKVGLSGRAVAIVPDDRSAARARKGAEEAGVLVEIEVAPPNRIPLENESIDVVVIDDTGGLLSAGSNDDRSGALGEALRILRPGGRAMIITAGAPAGLTAWFSSGATPPRDLVPDVEAAGFTSVRTLAERDGLVFVEGIRRRPLIV